MAATSGDMSMCGVSILFLLALETELGYIEFAIASIRCFGLQSLDHANGRGFLRSGD
jgi:hypothetical protein